MGHLPPQHMHTSKGVKSINKGFKFRWWMAIVLVVIVAGIGIAVLRFSRASTWPPEEQMKVNAGIDIKIGFPNVTVSYPPYGYKKDFLISLGEAKITELVAKDLEQIYIKNHPDAPPPVTPPVTPKPTTPTVSQTPQGQSTNSSNGTASSTASSDPTSTDSQVTTDSSQQAAVTTDEQSKQSVELSQSKDLGTVSGYVKFVYVPKEGQVVKSASLVIDNKIFKIIKKAPYEFAFDTRAYSNGKHKMQLFVTTDNNSTTETIYQVNVDNSSLLQKILYYFGLPWTFIFPG